MKKKYLIYILPLLAILVVAESLILMSKTKGGLKDIITDQQSTVKNTTKNTEFDIELSTEKSVVQTGDKFVVTTSLRAIDSRKLDALSLYIKYDPTAFDLDKLSYDEKLPKPVFMKVSESKKLVVANYMISEAEGLGIEKDGDLELLSFEAVAKKSGEFVFEISTGDETKESATMFVESATAREIPFVSNKLTVNVD